MKKGILITQPEKDAKTATLNDLVYTSQYQSMMLVKKVTRTITVGPGSCTGTHTYDHELDYTPFVIGYLYNTVSFATAVNPVILPFFGEGVDPIGVTYIAENIELKVTSTQVQMPYNVYFFLPGINLGCPDYEITYTIDLYFYALEMGSSMPD